jgi:hypothetical protein
MSWLQFIDSMFGHLAWPLVVLVVAFALRRHLGPLTERVRELTIGPASLKFGDLLEKGSQLIEQAPTVPMDNLVRATAPDEESPELPPPIGAPPAPEYNPEATAAETTIAPFPLPWATGNQPWSIISEWNEIELQFAKVGELFYVKTRDGKTLLDMLYKQNLISKEAVELYDTLRQARNEAVHGKVAPSEFQVAEFVRQAAFFKNKLTFAMVQLRLLHKNERVPR